jgi:hypothetical protein
MVYNLGESKLVIQNILRIGSKRTFILNLDADEKFVAFVHFKKFEDAGFFIDDLRVECCSHFLYMTRAAHGDQAGNRLNLLFIDPFFEKP